MQSEELSGIRIKKIGAEVNQPYFYQYRREYYDRNKENSKHSLAYGRNLYKDVDELSILT